MNLVEREHIIMPSLSGSDATVTITSRFFLPSAIQRHRNVTGLTISAANLDILTLSVQFADACDVAQLVWHVAKHWYHN